LPRQVDVLVVGAGPAGLSAAWNLAAAGVRPLLVDARAEIGSPVRCAELTRAMVFSSAGIKARPEWVRWQLERGWLVLDRPAFESGLAALLAAAGARVRARTSAVGIGRFECGRRIVALAGPRGPSVVSARVVIAADGVGSRVARLAGLDVRLGPRQIARCLAYRVADVELARPRATAFAEPAALQPFYSWLIPCGAHEANVGVAALATDGRPLEPLLHEALRQHGASRGRVIETIGGCYPSAPPLERPHADGLLVAGTAARLVDAVWGEGIWPAVLSGRLAARATLAALAGEPARPLSDYRDALEPLHAHLRRALQFRHQREQSAARAAGAHEGSAQPAGIGAGEAGVECPLCGGCVAVCRSGSLAFRAQGSPSRENGRIARDARTCSGCGACQRACPIGCSDLSLA
jgi:digeranylgeranylglycerophospholipid reductase